MCYSNTRLIQNDKNSCKTCHTGSWQGGVGLSRPFDHALSKISVSSSSIDYGLQLEKVWYDSIWEKLHNVQERSCSCQFRGSCWAYTS